MELRPEEAPVYGAVPIELDITGGQVGRYYLAFEGSRLRHVTSAQIIRSDGNVLTLLSTVPAHDRIETVSLTAYVQCEDEEEPRSLNPCPFSYVTDSAYQMAQFLLDSVDDDAAACDLELVCRERFQLTADFQHRVDERLTAAFRALPKPTGWSLLPVKNRSSSSNPPETLLHFAARLGLVQLSEYLVSLPGSLAALHTANLQGLLPETLAAQSGYTQLADFLSSCRSKQAAPKDSVERQLAAASALETSPEMKPPVVTTDPVYSNRDTAQDIDLLERMLATDRSNRVESVNSDINTTSCEDFGGKEVVEEEDDEECTVASRIIPVISITPNSPKHKTTRILEEQVKLLHSIQDKIQNFRKPDRRIEAVQKSHLSRLSSSCPSIPIIANGSDHDSHKNYDGKPTMSSCSALDAARLAMVHNGSDDIPSDSDWIAGASNIKIQVNDITPTSSQEFLQVGYPESRRSSAGSQSINNNNNGSSHIGGTSAQRCAKRVAKKDIFRRQSWSALNNEDAKDSETQPKLPLQRSVSLNSLDSETEEAFYEMVEGRSRGLSEGRSNSDSLETLGDKQRNRSASSGEAICHALASQRSPQTTCLDQKEFDKRKLFGSANAAGILLPPHSPLQKSISTPSIIAAQEVAERHSTSNNTRESRNQYSGPQDSDDEKPFGKRKKRGSLFFRKRKGRDKDSKKAPHQFVSVCYSTSVQCHVCSKPLANKPALRCETCFVTVHDSACKDQLVDCAKLKSHKSLIKPTQLLLKEKGVPTTLQLPGASMFAGHIPHYPYRYRHLLGPVSHSMIHLATSKSSSPSHAAKERKQSSGSKATQGDGSSSNASSPSKVISEEKEADTPEDTTQSNIIDINSASMESLDEGAQEVSDLEDDPVLCLMDEEPEAWSSTADKKVLKKLKEKDVKRQEAIYELIITEKHHCLTLKIMQKVFAQGMIKELAMNKDWIEKIFPCLEELLEVHLSFLKRLRERQLEDPVVEGIGDILLSQFQGETADQMRSAYGHFCSQHKEAVLFYKEILKTDKKFQTFIRKCSLIPVCKARGIPECILLVTQRVTKYPLLIDTLIKATKENKVDRDNLIQAQICVKEILNQVDAQVAEKEKKQRLLDIYNKVDAKSTAYYKGKKFKKSDFLSNNRKLRHEGAILLKNARGKQLDVIAVVLSDVIFFLQENNQKYVFASFDNKSNVISLQKLLLRERAGQDSKGIYLISSQPNEPEMYELICSSAKEKTHWMEIIRGAAENCPDDDEGVPSETEEERKLEEARASKLKELIGSLKDKDKSLAQICEEKMHILLEILETLGVDQDIIDNINPSQFKYSQLMEKYDSVENRKLIMNAAGEAINLANSIYVSGTNLSRSVSSAGEHQSDNYVFPILPKRAETFGGFDNSVKDPSNASKALALKKKLLFLTGDAPLPPLPKEKSEKETHDDPRESLESRLQVKGIEMRRSSSPLPLKPSSGPGSPEKQPQQRRSIVGITSIPSSAVESPTGSLSASNPPPHHHPVELIGLTTTSILLSQGKEQLAAIVELTHHVHAIMCLYSHHVSAVESLRTRVSELTDKLGHFGKDGKDRKGQYRPEHQLEELRNLQEQLSQERAKWYKECAEQQAQLNQQREAMNRTQEQVKAEQADVAIQREMLYRRLEALQKEGIILSSSLNVVNLGSNISREHDISNHSDPPSYSDSSQLEQHVRSHSLDAHFAADLLSGGIHSSTTTNDPRHRVERSKVSHSNSTISNKSRESLPMHLCSATNMQKRPMKPTVKQQLPLKLASGSLSSSNGVPPPQATSVTSGVPVSPGVQQVLPLKLASSSSIPKDHAGNKQKLPQRSHSASCSPSSTLTEPIHIRAGSSPAKVQYTLHPSPGVKPTVPEHSGSSLASKAVPSIHSIVSRPVEVVQKNVKPEPSAQPEENDQEIFC